MARSDPWAAFADEVTPTRADDAVAAPKATPGAQPAPVQDEFAQLAEPVDQSAEVVGAPTEFMFNDQIPDRAATRFAPEDEAELIRILSTGPIESAASEARRFAASKGFSEGGDNFDEVIAARQKTGKINDNIDYRLPEMQPDDGATGAFGRGVADVPTIGLLDEAGAVVDALGGTDGRQSLWNSDEEFGDLYRRNLDINRGIIDADDRDHKYARVSGQILGGLLIPSNYSRVALKAGAEALRAGKTMQEARAVAAGAASARMTKEAAAIGGGYGVGSGEGVEGRLTGGVTGAVTGAAGGAVAGKVGEVIGGRQVAKAVAARAEPLTDAQRTVAAADRIGMDVLPADVGGPATRLVTAAAAQAPLSAHPVITAAQRVIERGKAVRNEAGASIGQAMNREGAGEAAAEGVMRAVKDKKGRIGRIYDTAAGMAGDTRIELTSAKTALDEQIARLSEVPGGGAGLADAKSMRASLEGQFTVQGVRDMRTELFVAPDFRGTPVERRMREIVDTASNDIENGLIRAGKANAAKAFRAADDQWRDHLKTMKSVIEPIIGKSGDKLKSGEEIVAGLERAGKGNGRRFEAFLKELPDEERGIVRATLIESLGRSSAGKQDASGDAFSLDQFLTHWNTMGERAKAATFGVESRSALNDLATVASASKEAGRYANHSNTSGGILGNLGALMGWGALEPFSATGAAVTQLITGPLMASPRFARRLARSAKTKTSPGVFAKQLTSFARSEPSLANDALGLRDAILRAANENVRPNVAASGRGDEQDRE